MRNKRPPCPLESDEQIALFAWRDLFMLLYPELLVMYAIPNGGYRPKRTGNRMKKQGTLKGIPDICLPVPRGKYGSLYIELKRQYGGVETPEQKIVIPKLRQYGNMVEVCKGKDAAISVILAYLKL